MLENWRGCCLWEVTDWLFVWRLRAWIGLGRGILAALFAKEYLAKCYVEAKVHTRRRDRVAAKPAVPSGAENEAVSCLSLICRAFDSGSGWITSPLS